MQDALKTRRLLGQGSFGIVIQVKHSRYGEVALKIRDDDPNEKCHEGEIGIRLRHENILNCLEFHPNCTPTSTLTQQVNKLLRNNGSDKRITTLMKCHYLFAELCNGGDLQTWLTRPNQPTRTRASIVNFFAQIIEGVEFLHSEHNLVHGDLKPANVLLHHTKDGTIIKIIDFGETVLEGGEGDGGNRRLALTELYSDPEWALSRTTKAYDIYTLACIFVVMFLSEACHFNKDLIRNKTDREKALAQLLLSVKAHKNGLATVTRNAYACRESMVSKMLVKYRERPTISAVKEIFTSIARQPQVFSKACLVPGKNPIFSGRKKIIRDLSKLLEQSNATFILLHGIPGTGKKSIASELCHQYSESTLFSRGIFWFRADSRRILENCYSKLIGEEKQIGNINKLPGWLEQNSSQNGRLLVVYENVKCFSEIQNLLPHRGDIAVICTSRDSGDWPQEYQKFMVPILPLKDCVSFANNSMRLVNKRWGQNSYSELEDVHRLVTKVGQITTAIEAAVVFISNQNNGISSISAYLKLYKNSVPAQALPYHAALLTTANKINEMNSTAFTWLRICSYLDTEGIPKVLLETLLDTGEDKDISKTLHDIIELLSSYSVLTYEYGTKSFSIPRAVQESIQVKYKSSFLKTMCSIGSILRVVIPVKNKYRKDDHRAMKLRDLAPHLEALVEHIKTYEVNQNITNCSLNYQDKEQLRIMKLELLKALRRFYTTQSNPDKTFSTVEQITLTKDKLYGESEWLRALELMAKGKACMTAAVMNRPIAVPMEYPKMLEAISILMEAKSVFSQCKNSSRKIEVIQCYLHLGRCFRSFLHTKYMHQEIRCQISAEILDKVDDYAKTSKSFYSDALQLLIELSKEKRKMAKMICMSLKEIGWCHYFQQDVVNYEKYLVVALMCSGVQFELSNELVHPMVQILMNIPAFEVCDDTLNDELVGESHINPEEAYIIVEMLKQFYKKTGRKDVRLKMLTRYRNRLMRIKKNTKSKKSTDTEELSRTKLTSKSDLPLDTLVREKMHLATECRRQRKFQDALLLYEDALKLSISLHKRDSVLIANVYENIGECHSKLGNIDAACNNYKEAYKLWGSDVRRRTLQYKNTEFAELIQKYVGALPKSKWELKVQLLEEVVSIHETTFGKNHRQIGVNKEKIGTIFLKLGRYQDAVRPLEEGLKILETIPQGNFDKLRCLKSLVDVSSELAEKKHLVQGYKTTLEAEKKAADGYQRTSRCEKNRRNKLKFLTNTSEKLSGHDLQAN